MRNDVNALRRHPGGEEQVAVGRCVNQQGAQGGMAKIAAIGQRDGRARHGGTCGRYHFMHGHDQRNLHGVQQGVCVIFMGRDPAKKEILMLNVRQIRAVVQLLSQLVKKTLRRQVVA